MDMETAFEILGLPGNPSTQEIKAAFRRLANQYHPDKPDGDAQKFIEVRTAYEVVVNFTPDDEPCPTCFGTGKVIHTHGWSSIKVNCPTCSN